MLPKLFIGSSDEARTAGLLDALQSELEAGLNVPTQSIELVPWVTSPWGNMTVAVQSLVENLVDYSYGVFILSADDELSHRGADHYTARDNVIFEFGLFLAHLGPERTFLIGPSNIHQTIAMSAVKTSAPHTTPPRFLPLRILTDLGSAYRKGGYTIADPGPSPKITFQVTDVIDAIKKVEATASGLTSADANSMLIQRLLEAKVEINKPGKGDAFYSGQFFSRFRDLATLKAKATLKSVQEAVQDLLLYLERVADLCDIGQLARLQHHSQNIDKVWVFAEEPLEFSPSALTDPTFQELRKTIIENLKNDVHYVYFVGPDFKKDQVDSLVGPKDPKDPKDRDRAKMVKQIHFAKIHPQFFSTYFTLHFQKGEKDPKAIYMSSVMRDRKDVLIQVSDSDHVERIYKRISALYGVVEDEHSPRVTRHVL